MLYIMKSYFHKETNTINAFEVEVPEETKKLNVVSLFSGVGGMDLGFRGNFDFLGTQYSEQPFNLIFSNDIFKQAADV